MDVIPPRTKSAHTIRFDGMKTWKALWNVSTENPKQLVRVVVAEVRKILEGLAMLKVRCKGAWVCLRISQVIAERRTG